MVKRLRIFNNFNIPKKYKKSIILIGNFDGLHSGHQKLFELAKKYKTKYESKVGVVTFDPIPKMFFNTKIKNYRISNFSQKVIYLKKFGVDFGKLKIKVTTLNLLKKEFQKVLVNLNQNSTRMLNTSLKFLEFTHTGAHHIKIWV